MKEKFLSHLKSGLKWYIVCFVVLGILSLAVLLIRGHFAETNELTRYANIADAFTVPSLMMLLVGLLMWIASKGSFDLLTYGLRGILNFFFPFSRFSNENYEDYRERKEKNRKSGYCYMIISGAIYFIPALILNLNFTNFM